MIESSGVTFTDEYTLDVTSFCQKIIGYNVSFLFSYNPLLRESKHTIGGVIECENEYIRPIPKITKTEFDTTKDNFTEVGLTYRLNGEYFYICVDLEKLTFDRYNVCKNTTLAIDMNPNYIGLCIINPNDKIIHKQVYDLSKIKNNNKRDYELTQIAISIAKLCKHYRVEMVGYEKLKIYSSNKGKGRRFNKQVNNDWHRGIFVNSLHKWLGIINCKWVEIIPEYSSYIGCIMYENETDSIAASIELNRRLREYKSIYIDKTKSKGNIVYPLFTMSHFNRWKESLDDRVFKDWKESYQWFKETKHSYRLTYPLWLKHNGIRPFRYKSFKSMINHVII